MLQELLLQMRDKLSEVRSKRNYIQNDRDMIETFYQNTQKEINELTMKISNLDSAAEKSEINYRAKVKTHLQNAKLEYDRKIFVREIKNKEKTSISEEEAYQQSWRETFKSKKQELTQDILKDEQRQQLDVKRKMSADQKRLDKTRENYHQKLEDFIKEQENKFAKAKEDLELKMKVDIHQVEENKNLHLNELMASHEKAFSELKSYYNEITTENLKLIQAQKSEIDGVQASLVRQKKLIETIKSENRTLQPAVEEVRKKRDKLKAELNQHEKDKMLLPELRNRYIALNAKISKAKNERDNLSKRFEQVSVLGFMRT